MLDKAGTDTVEQITAVVKDVAAHHGLNLEFAPTDCLVDRGLTSMAIVDMILALEAKFDITIPQRELTPANLRSIASLGQLVDRL